MTTTAYDTHFMASDIAFTVNRTEVTLNIPFRKVKRLGEIVFGMAGCLFCMRDFSEALIDFILQNKTQFELPRCILEKTSSDFIALIYLSGSCLKVSKMVNHAEFTIENITNVPTVIGSGSLHTQHIIQDCPNAIAVVLEAIKYDQYTAGEVKYCSIKREEVHNLEAPIMSTTLNNQIQMLQTEIAETNQLVGNGNTYHANTETYHHGEPVKISTELGLQMFQHSLTNVRNKLTTN